MCQKIVIADDHRLFAEGLSSLLQAAELEVCAIVGTRDLVPDLIHSNPDAMLLMDLNMPGMGIPELLALPTLSQTKVLAITGEKDWTLVKQLMGIGVLGVVLKEYSFDEILHAISAVARGEKYISTKITENLLFRPDKIPTLTQRQLEVLRFVAAGYPSKRIATRMNLHVKTVDNHRSRIMEKLGVHSAAEMVKVAKDHGLI